MKKVILAIVLLGLIMPTHASEIVPPRIIVKWLIVAVQEGRDEVIEWYFKFDKEKHTKLTPLSREEQIRLLKDIAVDKIRFDKDEYSVDAGKRFVVRLVAPKKLDFEIDVVDLKGEKGPPSAYNVLAIRETAQHGAEGDALGRAP